MKTLFAILISLGLLVGAAFAQPTITQVQNAASNIVAPNPNSAVAPSSFFSIYGTNIGPSTFAYWGSYPLQTTVSGVSVTVTVGGTQYPAYPEFVSAGQINAVLADNTATGSGTVTVTYNGATSAPFNITIVPMSFGIFTQNEAGSGPGSLENAISYVLITPFTTVQPGGYATIYGTGLGAGAAQPNQETSGPTPINLCPTPSNCPVTVWVGGVQASVQYAARSAYVGEDEIVFIVPTEAAVQGCYVSLAVQTTSGGSTVVSNFSSLAIDPTGPTCSDQDGINYADVASQVSQTGSANVGAIDLLSNYLDLVSLGATWDNDTLDADFGTFSSYVFGAFQGLTISPSVNNCTVDQFFGFPPPADPALGYVSFLDAGAQLGIQGPNGSASVSENTNGKGYGGLVGGETIAELLGAKTNPPYYLNSSDAIVPGSYTVTGTGGSTVGSTVGAFSAGITVSQNAANFKWTNQTAVTGSNIPRTTPLTITWSGGDTNGFVDITAIASTLASGIEPSKTTPGMLVECIAPASAGTFTIPTYVLQALPSTAASTAITPPGELLVGPASVTCSTTIGTSSTCPADYTLPSGLDALYIFYHFIAGATVTWQ